MTDRHRTAIRVVDELDGRYTVWYDYNIDQPFPSGAEPLTVHATFPDAAVAALQANEEYEAEYGVTTVVGPTPCSEIQHSADDDDAWRYCCGLLYDHEGPCDYRTEWA